MISKKYKEVIKNLEENIDSKRDLEYAKKQIADLTVLYIDELTKVIEKFEKKIQGFDNRVSNVEKDVRNIEDELYNEQIEEEDSMLDLEPIKCPYCDFKFLIEYNTSRSEIKCPECDNLIELDWEELEEDM